MYGEAERDGAVEPGEERGSGGILPMCINTWYETLKRKKPSYFHPYSLTG